MMSPPKLASVIILTVETIPSLGHGKAFTRGLPIGFWGKCKQIAFSLGKFINVRVYITCVKDLTDIMSGTNWPWPSLCTCGNSPDQ